MGLKIPLGTGFRTSGRLLAASARYTPAMHSRELARAEVEGRQDGAKELTPRSYEEGTALQRSRRIPLVLVILLQETAKSCLRSSRFPYAVQVSPSHGWIPSLRGDWVSRSKTEHITTLRSGSAVLFRV